MLYAWWKCVKMIEMSNIGYKGIETSLIEVSLRPENPTFFVPKFLVQNSTCSARMKQYGNICEGKCIYFNLSISLLSTIRQLL